MHYVYPEYTKNPIARKIKSEQRQHKIAIRTLKTVIYVDKSISIRSL